MAKKTAKVIGIVEDNAITGIRYGEIEVPAETTDATQRANRAARAYATQVKQIKVRKVNPKCRSN